VLLPGPLGKSYLSLEGICLSSLCFVPRVEKVDKLAKGYWEPPYQQGVPCKLENRADRCEVHFSPQPVLPALSQFAWIREMMQPDAVCTAREYDQDAPGLLSHGQCRGHHRPFGLTWPLPSPLKSVRKQSYDQLSRDQ
jgi:hypothetical protein